MGKYISTNKRDLSDLSANQRICFSSHAPGGGDGAYSYKGRDLTSRAAARDRRFGETDITGAGSYDSKGTV